MNKTFWFHEHYRLFLARSYCPRQFLSTKFAKTNTQLNRQQIHFSAPKMRWLIGRQKSDGFWFKSSRMCWKRRIENESELNWPLKFDENIKRSIGGFVMKISFWWKCNFVPVIVSIALISALIALTQRESFRWLWSLWKSIDLKIMHFFDTINRRAAWILCVWNCVNDIFLHKLELCVCVFF